ncbi:MAG: hypothetical protein AB8G99_02100 [Planctomycetaceae bacterium]
MRSHRTGTPIRLLRGMTKRFPCGNINRLVACFIMLCLIPTGPLVANEWLTGSAFGRELKQSITGRITNRSLRDALQQLAMDRGVAVVIDRRIDPDQRISVRLETFSLLESIEAIASEAEAGVSVLENVVVVGRRESMRNLATLIRLRQKEARKIRSARSLREKKDFGWEVLSEPRTVLDEVLADSGIQVKESAVIPHDLWAAATLPKTDGVTAVSVILIQFGMTFRFDPAGKAIEAVPEPESVAIEERVRVSSKAPANLLEIVGQQFPRVKVRRSGSSLRVSGTVESIEAIRDLALGRKPEVSQRQEKTRMDDVSYTLTASQVPARAIFERMKEQGTPVEWDDSDLKSAGVDLDKLVAVDVRKATMTQFVKILCDQIGAEFRVEKYRVVLFPKR